MKGLFRLVYICIPANHHLRAFPPCQRSDHLKPNVIGRHSWVSPGAWPLPDLSVIMCHLGLAFILLGVVPMLNKPAFPAQKQHVRSSYLSKLWADNEGL